MEEVDLDLVGEEVQLFRSVLRLALQNEWTKKRDDLRDGALGNDDGASVAYHNVKAQAYLPPTIIEKREKRTQSANAIAKHRQSNVRSSALQIKISGLLGPITPCTNLQRFDLLRCPTASSSTQSSQSAITALRICRLAHRLPRHTLTQIKSRRLAKGAVRN